MERKKRKRMNRNKRDEAITARVMHKNPIAVTDEINTDFILSNTTS